MKSNLPESSLLKNLPHDYLDSYSAILSTTDLTIEQVGKSFFTSGAGEQDALLQGFKCEVGERFGLFKVFAKNENEIILGEDDKHLDFRVSLFLDKQNQILIVSTVVKIHNWLGRLYFLPVKPFHKLIVPTMANGMVKQLIK